MSEIFELVARFLLVGAVAFGGGGTALPLVERITVAETGWLSPQQFAIGVGFAYATPGPILILAAFVGYHVSGLAGALVATAAVFAIPVVLAAGAAGMVARLNSSARFRTFGRFAAAAAVGLLAVTLFTLARPVVKLHPGLLAGAAVVLLAERRGVSPVLLLAIAAAAGAVFGLVAG